GLCPNVGVRLCHPELTSARICNSGTITRDTFGFCERNINPNAIPINATIARFQSDRFSACGQSMGQGHDMILGISDWTLSGHGAWVQQFMFRAERWGWEEMAAVPTVWPVSEPMLLCMDGFMANASGTDCVPRDELLCGRTNMCTGWSVAQFNSAQHVMRQHESCFEFRCVNSGYGFIDDSRNCAPCIRDARDGINREGECVRCPTGQVFEHYDGICVPAMRISAQRMIRHQSRDCFVLNTPDEFFQCVMNRNREMCHPI
ncbi:MAG: hypothetical protein FWC83_01635, partial [Alphaproteobacteria bacterium]|nr:hypothetical protein [Alphaproteobacteria bacterium]